MILRSGSYAASRGTTPPPYQRLSVDEKNQASELVAEKAIAALPDSFEEWQFDRAQWAHYLSFGAFVPIEIIFAVFIDTTEDLAVSRREDTTYAILASLLLAARILASQGSSDLKPVWRRVVIILYVGMLFTAQLSSIVVLEKMHPKSHAMPTSDFVSEAYLYIFGNLVAPAVAASLAIDRRTVTLFIQLPTLVLMYLMLAHSPTGLPDEEPEALWDMTACSLIASWIIGFIGYFSADAQNREMHATLRASRGWAGAKGRYIAAMSHDFGTPIAMLQMLLGKLEREPEQVSAIGGHRLRAMHAALQLLSTIRQKAMNLNRLEMGQGPQPERASCSVRELLERSKLVAEHMPKRESVAVEFHLSDSLGHGEDAIVTDIGWLFLIVINFLSNSFKHMRNGTVSVRIEKVDNDKAGPTLRLLVADTGLGVPDDLIPHLFTPYTQASKWRFGTGLGLYHVHELANALGGVARYAPNDPTGAIFWVDVPFVPAEASDLQPERSPSFLRSNSFYNKLPPPELTSDSATAKPNKDDSPPNIVSPRTTRSQTYPFFAGRREPTILATKSPERSPQLEATSGVPLSPHTVGSGLPDTLPSVLVVEDDQFIRELTVALLLDVGVQRVDTAADGEEGLTRLTSVDQPVIMLALVDLQMPLMDGFECVRRLREWEAKQQSLGRNAVWAIAVSANSDDAGCHADCMQAGFDQVMAKPLSVSKLRQLLLTVQEAIDNKKRENGNEGQGA